MVVTQTFKHRVRRGITRSAAIFGLSALAAGGAFADPDINGFRDPGDGGTEVIAPWYNNNGGEYGSMDPGQLTSIYYDYFSATMELYLYIEAPLAAKTMVWGEHLVCAGAFQPTGCDPKWARYYASDSLTGPFDTDGSNVKKYRNGDRASAEKMIKSEYVSFGGITADLGRRLDLDKVDYFSDSGTVNLDSTKSGKAKYTPDVSGALSGATLEEYADSVDYVVANRNCGTTLSDPNGANCGASDVPMGFEFLFSSVTQQMVDNFLAGIGKVVFHLSPSMGGPGGPCNTSNCNGGGGGNGVPAPSVLALLAFGLVFASRRRRTVAK